MPPLRLVSTIGVLIAVLLTRLVSQSWRARS
jgi:hypothetical protein